MNLEKTNEIERERATRMIERDGVLKRNFDEETDRVYIHEQNR